MPRDELDANELTFYQGQVAALNESLDTIRKWLHGSIEPFTKQELMASLEGQNLFLDFYLAEVWDFSQDIVLLWGSPVGFGGSLKNQGCEVYCATFR